MGFLDQLVGRINVREDFLRIVGGDKKYFALLVIIMICARAQTRTHPPTQTHAPARASKQRDIAIGYNMELISIFIWNGH